MEPINVGIIGSGANANRHIEALRKLSNVKLTGCLSTGKAQTKDVYLDKINLYTNPDRFLEDIDAVIITNSESSNYKLVIKALRRGKHVMLYPVMLRSINEAIQFVKLAREANVILKSGSVGNIHLQGLESIISDVSGIKLIELHYYKSISEKKSANPILEALLINAQVIHSLIKSHVISIKAKGIIITSTKPEIINARLEYDNGCAVNITCNTISARDDFQASIVTNDRCIKYDFISRKLTSWHFQQISGNPVSTPPYVHTIRTRFKDPLSKELSDFISSARTKKRHYLDAESGFDPFILTESILGKVRESVIQYT